METQAEEIAGPVPNDGPECIGKFRIDPSRQHYRFAIDFGYINHKNKVLLTSLNRFLSQGLMKLEAWPVQYDSWDPEGTDWGWMWMSSAEVEDHAAAFAKAKTILELNGFELRVTQKGDKLFVCKWPVKQAPTKITSSWE